MIKVALSFFSPARSCFLKIVFPSLDQISCDVFVAVVYSSARIIDSSDKTN